MKQKPRAPKQLRHWAERHGFRLVRWKKSAWRDYPIFRSKKPIHVSGCKSKSRYIRILPELQRIDICDGYFDRWANSTGVSLSMPRSQAEFDSTLKTLLANPATNGES